MAELQAKALFAFSGQEADGELTFDEGEILTVVRQDIEDGWWEARNSQGQQGLIPESYVEVTSFPEPAFPPPPPPNAPPVAVINNQQSSHNQMNQGNNNYNQTSPPPYSNNNLGEAQSSFDDWDDDWDDDDESTPEQDYMRGGSGGLSVPQGDQRSVSPSRNSADASKYGTVKKSFSRFSTFAKSGGESFLLGQTQASVNESDLVRIVDSPLGPIWMQPSSPYTCVIASPKKESKLKGLKSFIAYQLTPSFSKAPVSRRYKHFDWLHERLEEKYPIFAIPPLPEKQIAGRYEDDFITERMRQLQLWVNRIVRHPVISQCEVLLHFLTCSDEKKWKQGKRKAEKDEFVGAKFFLTIETPPHPLDLRTVEPQMEQFGKFVRSVDDSVKHLINVYHDNMKKHHGPFKREYEKIGHSIKALAASFSVDSQTDSQALTTAVDNTGNTYNEIGQLFEQQPKHDIIPTLEGLYEYKGILQTLPDTLKLHEGAMAKAKECVKNQAEGKLSESDVQGVTQRADIISYASLAEMHHFHQERVYDFKHLMQGYLQGQIDFYKKITAKLEQSLAMYDKA
ncbi:sorting nexin lst-4-like isoform X2 [Liolophura sinensis]|uniref:sorting nexin lst-4-like isoform X2 n=1 Tax=Liolophura sinensis TaxID=3198878 RepID=UPI00315958D2